ncbi:MAG: hypothetical protein RSE21_03970 [Bacilli bacterium]
MDKIIVPDKKLNIENYITDGSEGTIYEYNNKVIKIFFRDNDNFSNKHKKIEILSKMELDNFIFPKKLVYNKNEEFIGYMMEKVNFRYNNIQSAIDNSETLKEKIEILKKLENMIKKAHEKNIVLVDLNFYNFLIGWDNEIYAVDTDNYNILGYKHDLNPTFYYRHYIYKVSKEITSDIDKMSFAINLLYLLCKERINRNCFTATFKSYDYDKVFISSLDIDNELKEKLFCSLSDSLNKPYIGDSLDLLNENDSFIYKRKR